MRPVLITRQHAAPMDDLLRARGCTPLHLPLLRLQPAGLPPPPGGPPALAVITSATTAHLGGAPLRDALAGARVVAVGQKTAAALAAIGLHVDAVGTAGGAEAIDLARHIASAAPGPAWYVGAARPSAEVEAALAAWPAPVSRWCIYENVVPAGLAEDLRALLAGTEEIVVVTLASASAAHRYAALRSGGAGERIAVIGTSTAEAARSAGLRVDALARQPTLEGLCDAAASLLV